VWSVWHAGSSHLLVLSLMTLANVPIGMLDMTLPWNPNRSTRRSGVAFSKILPGCYPRHPDLFLPTLISV